MQCCRLYEVLKPTGIHDATDTVSVKPTISSDIGDNELLDTDRTDELQYNSECICIPDNNDEH